MFDLIFASFNHPWPYDTANFLYVQLPIASSFGVYKICRAPIVRLLPKRFLQPFAFFESLSVNLPNKLTCARLVFTMVFLGISSIPVAADGSHLLWWRIGLVIAVITGGTDFLDGWIARKYNLVTTFGKLMDPLADKVFGISCFVILTAQGVCPAWVTVAILTRELAVNGLRLIAASKGVVIAAVAVGKAKTLLQMTVLSVGGLIWVDVIPLRGLKWSQIDDGALFVQGTWWAYLLYATAIYTVYTGWAYFSANRDVFMNEDM